MTVTYNQNPTRIVLSTRSCEEITNAYTLVCNYDLAEPRLEVFDRRVVERFGPCGLCMCICMPMRVCMRMHGPQCNPFAPSNPT